MKDIRGYEGLYGITSCGKVWSYKSKKFLKPENVKGYLRVCLCKNYSRKKVFIHRLVAEAYIDNPYNLATVDHIDTIKTHNWASNLQWLSAEDNIKKAQNEGIICIELKRKFVSQMEAAKELNISQGNISAVISGKRETAGGYHWEKF